MTILHVVTPKPSVLQKDCVPSEISKCGRECVSVLNKGGMGLAEAGRVTKEEP